MAGILNSFGPKENAPPSVPSKPLFGREVNHCEVCAAYYDKFGPCGACEDEIRQEVVGRLMRGETVPLPHGEQLDYRADRGRFYLGVDGGAHGAFADDDEMWDYYRKAVLLPNMVLCE